MTQQRIRIVGINPMLGSAMRVDPAMQCDLRPVRNAQAPGQGEVPTMSVRPRTLLLLLAALLTLVVAGCGSSDDSGSGGKEASSDQSVDQLLKQTFTGEKKVDSGKLDLKVNLDVKSSSSQLQGPITLSLSGPFQSEGKGKLPKFDMDASFAGGGQNFKAGLASTGTKAFVNFQGTEYAVSDEVFQEFKKGYEQAQAQNKQQGGQSLATLGIDPQKWLTNAKNEGETKVGDTDVIKITGDVDVNKLLDDVNTALEKVRSLGVQGSAQLPEKLTDAQKTQAADAIKNLNVEIYTGKDDSTLRRMVVNMDINDGQDSGSLKFDVSLTDLNEDQEISEPSNAKPFDQLLSQLGGLGLGGLSGGGSSSGSGSSGGASADQLKKYSDCVQAAGSDVQKAQKCSKLLSP
jgi:hypothetical protein